MKWILLGLLLIAACQLAIAQDGTATPSTAASPPTAEPQPVVDRRAALPNKEQVREQLLRIADEGLNQARAKELVGLLGHDDFKEREQATAALKASPWILHAWQLSQQKPAKVQLVSQLPTVPNGLAGSAVSVAASSPGAITWLNPAVQSIEEEAAMVALSPEVRWRMQKLLPAGKAVMEKELLGVLEAIRQQHLSGLGKELLACASIINSTKQLLAMGESIAATSAKEDRGVMVVSSKSTNMPTRYLALMALAPIAAAEDVTTILLPAQQDADEWIRLAAARGGVVAGQKVSLNSLAKLLESETEDVRSEANSLLLSVTGQDLGYLPSDAPDKRLESAKQWQVWTASAGQKSDLILPLQRLPRERGVLLLCDVAGKRLVEFDNTGMVVWEKKLDVAPWACQGLPTGHRMVCSAEAAVVFELDDQGNEVWRSKPLPKGPMSVQRLASGNTLVACSWSDTVIEVDLDGEIAWRAAVVGRPVDAQRLENGNTLVTLQNEEKVVEIDATGKQVAAQGDLGFVFGATRLRNGNLLSCDFRTSIVKEVAPGGKLIWSHQGFVCPILAQRLRSGNTLVSDRRGVKEISPDGREIRAWNMADVFRFCWY